ncbi:adenosine kinase [Meridianimarinicoccus roseus]|jgi:sugar/nucleoside kinase (ribokinase family)|nr:adenosine kinase [Meridianimarinicoccus roseus]
MSKSQPQIAGIGNPLVDVLASVGPDAPGKHGLTVGEMHLVDAATAKALYADIGPGIQQSGGSVANTIAHVGDMGLKGTFLGKVAGDDLGGVFRRDMAALGIDVPVPDQADGTATGHCVVMVTPDGERTMSTYLGACECLAPDDLPETLPSETAILLVEGYHFDTPHGAANVARAVELARGVGARIALTPSDAACVDRQRAAMLALIEGECDILIGNELELAALSGAQDPMSALHWALDHVRTVALTRSENGALLADGGPVVEVAAQPVPKVVDTTGAGDAFAAGFLSALALGKDVAEAGRAGASLAARVIGHFGAREAGTAA